MIHRSPSGIVEVTVEVIEEWRVVDQWWTDAPVEREYAQVLWGARTVIFWRETPERTWRVHAHGTEIERARKYPMPT